MSEPSPDTGWALSGWSRSLPPGLLRAERDFVRHMVLLQRCFDGREMRWSDAVIARTRRHAGGCVSSVEMALRLELEKLSSETVGLAGILPQGCCWRHVARDPALISSMLLAHFRDRAAISLMQQDDVASSLIGEQKAEAELFPEPVAEALSIMTLAHAGWADSGPDGAPIRADLPAEIMPELVWTVAAILADILIEMDILPAPGLLSIINRASEALLARHDEQNAPFALASLMAHQMRAADLNEAQLLHLARHRHILVLIAIIADRTGIDLITAVRTVVENTEQMLFTLCRAAEFPREVAVRLVLGRRSVARGVNDSMLVEYADGYDLMSPEEAMAAVAGLAVPEPLRMKLSLVRDRAGRDGR